LSYTRSRSANGQCHRPRGRVNRIGSALDQRQKLGLAVESMMNLNVIAAASTAHLWWRGQCFAARWRD
jgi:hypothetical protein